MRLCSYNFRHHASGIASQHPLQYTLQTTSAQATSSIIASLSDTDVP